MKSSGPAATELPWGQAWRVAAGQIVAWGVLYYAFTVVAGPMAAETGWSRTFMNLGLTVGLLAWGLGAYPAGLWIQRRGGRRVMTLANAAGGLALGLLSQATQPWQYLLCWMLLGVAMAGALYEPAFAVITAAFGAHYRRGIILVTLVGGLASTVFIPLAQLVVNLLGWRGGLLALGAMVAGIGVPLHWWGVADAPLPGPSDRGTTVPRLPWWRRLSRDLRDARFVGLALWFAAHAGAFTGLFFQLIPFLQARQVPAEDILTAIACMGPMQVAGRLLLSRWGEHGSSLWIGSVAMGGLVLAMLVLWLMPPTTAWLCVFASLFGLGNGVLTIVRGAAVAEFFGRARYAEINGAMAVPAVAARAGAPLAVAAAWGASGAPAVVPLSALALLGVGVAGLVLAARAFPSPAGCGAD